MLVSIHRFAMRMQVLLICLGFLGSLNCFQVSSRPLRRFQLAGDRHHSNLPEGFQFRDYPDGKFLGSRPLKPNVPIKVETVSELKRLIGLGYAVSDVDVRGDTAIHSDTVHPVVKALFDRKALNSTPGDRKDGKRIAVAIEGGGMRGCVACGMTVALWYLGLQDSVDVIYGSSAGAMVGAYCISDQMPHYGPEIYYDVLTTSGKDFIDKSAAMRAAGFGFLDIRFSSIMSLFKDRLGKPILNLNYLMDTVVQRIKPMNWDSFWEKQITKKCELKVVASGLISGKAVVMSAEKKNFQTFSELAECMKASMLLPGIAGDAIRLKGEQTSNILNVTWREYKSRTQSELILGGEPLTDAQLYEPIPYRSALKENCTHILAIRTKPDDISVTSKLSIAERWIASRFFGRKLGLPHLATWMTRQYHKLVYAEDVLFLNQANRGAVPVSVFNYTSPAYIYCLAMPPGAKEVKRLEKSRRVIFNSVKESFAVAHDALVIDPAQKGRGMEIADQIWPESILDQTPAHLPGNETTIKPKKRKRGLFRGIQACLKLRARGHM